MEKDVIEFEDFTEIYNSRIKLLNWLKEELEIQPNKLNKVLNKAGQTLPLNV